MPIKRTAEELERPPLPRGSACHRCFSRKVRCSGQPDPSSGVYGCSSCLRTARHRGHDVSQVRCSFEKDGLCSEEGGPTLSGEILPGAASTGPTRRQRPTARSSHSSSNNSSRSVVSTSSSARTDSYSTDASSVAPSSKPTPSPQPNRNSFPNRLPSPPANFQFPPPLPPPPRYPSSLPPLILPTAVPLSSQALAAVPDATQDELELPTPTANNTKTMQTLLHRRANAPSRQLSLSNVSTPSNGSPFPGSSPYIDDYRQQQQNSAPLMLPPSWPNGNSHNGEGGGGPAPQYAEYPNQHPLPQYYLDGPLPNTSFALDLAPFSALTPSTLAKMNLTPTSSYDFSSAPQQPSGITQPAGFSPTGVAFTGGGSSHPLTQSTSQPGDPSFASSLSGYASSSSHLQQHQQQHQSHQHSHSQDPSNPNFAPPPAFSYPSNYSLPLGAPSQYYSLPLGAPSQYYSSYQQPSDNQQQGQGGGLPTPGFASSFHLPSPGVTFSSSIPPSFREDQQGPRYYFERPNGGG